MRDRIREFVRSKGITEYRFLKEADLSLSFFTSSSKGVNAKTLRKIGDAFPDLNLSWVTTGEGTMTKTWEECIPVSEHLRIIRRKDEEIARLKGQLAEARRK